MRAKEREYECGFQVSEFLREGYTKSLRRPQVKLPPHYAMVGLIMIRVNVESSCVDQLDWFDM